jgi:tetratricopeptide (TPR) repeat protein
MISPERALRPREPGRGLRRVAPAEPSIFFSYAHADETIAHGLIERLKELGIRVWIANEELRAGDDTVQRISRALSEARLFVALVSNHSVQSEWCKKELSMAIEKSLRQRHFCVLPLLVDDVEEPPSLWGTLSLRVDSKDPLAVADRLVSHAQEQLGKSGEPDAEAKVIPLAAQVSLQEPCIGSSTLAALVARRAAPEEIRWTVEHLIGRPWQPGCRACRERLAALFLQEADAANPEVTAAKAFWNGELRSSPLESFNRFLHRESAGRPESGLENRSLPVQAVLASVLASFAFRYEPGASGLLSYAQAAVDLADAANDPWAQAIAHAWLSRVWSVRGNFHEAGREIDIALKAAACLEGARLLSAQAFLLHQLADLRLRLRDFVRARKDFECAIRLYRILDHPNMADSAEYSLAFTYTEAGQYKEARDRICKLLAGSQDRLLVTSALLFLSGDVLPNLAREGEPELAELALCLKAVIGDAERSETGNRARAFWRDGVLAWALGAPETALAFFDEARSQFRSLAPEAGLYEAALISLDMLAVRLESGPLAELQAYALQAASIFSALGADISSFVALGSFWQLEARAGVSAYLTQARIALDLAEKRRLLRSAKEEELTLTDARGQIAGLVSEKETDHDA